MRMTITNRMMMGASLLMMTFSFATKTNAETCTQVPTCAELGYTETTCGLFTSLKCPFDNSKLFCGTNCISGYVKDESKTDVCVAVKQVIYSGSTPIGVEISSHLAIAMNDASSTMQWEAAKSYCAGLTTGGKSWRLPTIDEGQLIGYNSSAINGGLAKISGATQLGNEGSWSSTEYSTSLAKYFWPLSANTGLVDKTSNRNVRCVFAF